ncbi:protein-glutamine gamma-glutamyltransferase [Alkalicoccobacillus murimartini]|uniref:Protein-glutamine gamma-glutamyltransferase n=1 Tax=Alkalicoccobacillus murimartini TaxID=171685 RepID=A0ABT9YE68_9BACI|nr:protein-glutamine gamma-glutamyltransferase [Alkalicoccobacillus murimartini]MDQ0206133.1 protein-glutamine gamma-glutamyltransferase [Alkalicoccobacillus murimartini]
MIRINGQLIQGNQLDALSVSNKQRPILKSMAGNQTVYDFYTQDELLFELTVRANTTQASYDLLQSGVGFADFDHSTCNQAIWTLTREGGFLLKSSVTPQRGIDDIFRNGNLYSFECAVAIIIIFYKATLDSIGAASFNQLFRGLYLFSWRYDEDLHLISHSGSEFLPGDCVYFNNPEFNPETPEWRGENTIVMEYDLYFGHGIGIAPGADIIKSLNEQRRPGARLSAYLENRITHPEYRYLRN